MSRPAGPLANPFFEEGARIYFGERTILRAYLVLLAVLGALLALWWPRGPVAFALGAPRGPATFTVVAVGYLLCVTWVSARCGAEDYSSASFLRLRDSVALTPAAPAAVMGGKLAFGLVHTLFLLALGLPFLLASLGVSGAAPGAGLRVVLVVGASALASRAFGLFLLTVLGEHALVRDFIMLAAAAALIPVSMAFFPAANPVSAILGLSAAADLPASVSVRGRAVPFHLFSVMVDLVGAAVLAAAALLRLVAARKAGEKGRP